ncbi:hypothetical protein PFUM301597_58110 [Pseudomonas fluorescens]
MLRLVGVLAAWLFGAAAWAFEKAGVIGDGLVLSMDFYLLSVVNAIDEVRHCFRRERSSSAFT